MVTHREGEDLAYFFFPVAVDPNHLSPQEAAWKSRLTFGGDANTRMARHFDAHKMPILIPPRSTVEGFVYTKLDEGVKSLSVLLVHPQRPLQFEWVADVPGIQLGHRQHALAALREQVGVQDVDAEELRHALEQLPCCTHGPDLKTPGDPLNIVIIGSGRRAFIPFVRQGWDPTETLSRDSVWRMIASSLFRGRYRTAPVSPLFVFGRPQDVALQKARATVDERNHLRVWLTPLRYQGLDVWIGQIRRHRGPALVQDRRHVPDRPRGGRRAVLPRALGRGSQDRLGDRRGAGTYLHPAFQLHGRSLRHRRHPRRDADG